jgi:hypothetical protein
MYLIIKIFSFHLIHLYIIIVLSKNVPILELNVIKLENVYELEM